MLGQGQALFLVLESETQEIWYPRSHSWQVKVLEFNLGSLEPLLSVICLPLLCHYLENSPMQSADIFSLCCPIF